MTNQEIGRRIKEARKEKGLTLEDIASEIGVARSTVQRYEAGKIDTIKLPVISAIADAIGVNDAWLVGKSDKKILTDADRFWNWAQNYNATHFQDDIQPIATQTLPVLGEIACGQPIYKNQDISFYTSVGQGIKADFILIAKGDSMTGARIFDGDLVFIRKQPTVENGEIAAVSIDDEVTLKRFFKYSDSLVVLRAENPSYEDIIINASDGKNVTILGKAVAFQSDVR